MMSKDYGPPMGDCCRQNAADQLRGIILQRRVELAGLEQMLKVAERTEADSPLEQLLWKVACGDKL